MYEELQWCTLTCISEERREEAINRLLKPAAPPDSGNGVVVPHEAPDGSPKPKKKGKKEPNSTCVLAITAPWSARVHAVARETHGRVCPLCYLLPVTVPWSIPPSGVARESSGPGVPLSYVYK